MQTDMHINQYGESSLGVFPFNRLFNFLVNLLDHRVDNLLIEILGFQESVSLGSGGPVSHHSGGDLVLFFDPLCFLSIYRSLIRRIDRAAAALGSSPAHDVDVHRWREEEVQGVVLTGDCLVRLEKALADNPIDGHPSRDELVDDAAHQ